MDNVSLVALLLGGLVLGLGLVSKWLDSSPLPATLLALLFGVAVGPAGLGLLDPAALAPREQIVEHTTRLALAVGLFGVALRVPRSFPRRTWRTLLPLLGLGMPLMWALSTAAFYLALPVDLWIAALLGGMVAATDPIAAGPVVTGPLAESRLPDRVRHTISFESGANDGLSYLIVFLPFLLLTRAPAQAWQEFLLRTLLWDVLASTVVGLLLGLAGARLLREAEKHDAIESEWRLIYTVALALAAMGLGRWMGSDELLMVFAAGVAFVQVIPSGDRKTEEHGQEAVNRFFSIPIFALLGMLIPWEGWRELGWRGILLVVLILLFRRLPAVLVLRPLLPTLRTRHDVLFVGWFGPVAVAAMYYAALVEGRFPLPEIWPAVTLVVVGSTVVHGISAAPLTHLYARTVRPPLQGA
jgi:sodium/hydrogen antiporter